MCGPLCPITIAGGLWLSRILGIDDLTLGLWIGALILSVAVQINKYLIKKGKNFPLSFWVILIVLTLLSFLPIYSKLDWVNVFCGLPRVISGSILGMVVLALSDWLNNWFLKKYHEGKVYFPYQRVIVPIIFLILSSFLVEIIFC
jgi:hypothetical protein